MVYSEIWRRVHKLYEKGEALHLEVLLIKSIWRMMLSLSIKGMSRSHWPLVIGKDYTFKWSELGLKNVLNIFQNFEIERIRHIDYCYQNNQRVDCKYYYIEGRKK
jgi:hypothetical protein